MSSYRFSKLNALELGAINGIIFGTLLEIGWHSLYIYETHKDVQTPLPSNTHIQIAAYPFNWWTLPALFLITASVASFLTHRYLSRNIKSSILLWQIIGGVAIFGCWAFSSVAIWNQWRAREELSGLSVPIESFQSELRIFIALLPLMLVFNLIFVAVLRLRKVQSP